MLKRIILLLILPSLGYSLPVLHESIGDSKTGLITILRDHENPNLAYFLPSSGEFAKNTDGSPLFGISTWATDGGGGYATFVLKGGISPEGKKAIAEFSEKNPNVKLAIVPIFDTSIVFGSKETNTKLTEKLISEVDLPPQAGVAETEIGGSMLLTGMGAKVISSLISTPASPLVFSLCYTIKAATPLMDATVTINYEKVYSHFATKSSYGSWWSWGEIRTQVEKLNELGHISVNILGGDAKLEDYLNRLTAEFANRFMIPSLDNNHLEPENRLFSMSHTYKEERKALSIRLQRRDFIEKQFCTALPMRDLNAYKEKIIVSADGVQL